jgi:hypothetical protein
MLFIGLGAVISAVVYSEKDKKKKMKSEEAEKVTKTSSESNTTTPIDLKPH